MSRVLHQDLGRLAAEIEGGLSDFGSALVAFSGGVDSGLVAALARRALGDRVLAVTAAAETLAGRELDHARALAREIGIEHHIVTYSELEDPEFTRNPKHRCYVCQGLRMSTMRGLADERGLAVVCDGTNASDLDGAATGDRPGLRAIREQGIRSPLAEHGLDKAATRSLARRLGLSVWDRPANACLSSRIPHGELVTLGKLRRIEAAEEILLQLGFQLVRVRSELGAARVEVGPDEIDRLRRQWRAVEPRLLALDFERAVLDERGYRSGGANRPGAA
ncbi:MAG TPA: ATP-dependent sacrificial sulfur transferase LarE [Thermoanaerobaculia bacterium]|nr:ATP-dependent sacrificial sulfur transferase LarE [Thermoanaerobaculia bacterium]